MPAPPRPQAEKPLGSQLPGGWRPTPQDQAPDDDWPVDRGRPLGLRLLALLGAVSFVMFGLSVVAPLLHPRPQTPAPGRSGAAP